MSFASQDNVILDDNILVNITLDFHHNDKEIKNIKSLLKYFNLKKFINKKFFDNKKIWHQLKTCQVVKCKGLILSEL